MKKYHLYLITAIFAAQLVDIKSSSVVQETFATDNGRTGVEKSKIKLNIAAPDGDLKKAGELGNLMTEHIMKKVNSMKIGPQSLNDNPFTLMSTWQKYTTLALKEYVLMERGENPDFDEGFKDFRDMLHEIYEELFVEFLRDFDDGILEEREKETAELVREYYKLAFEYVGIHPKPAMSEEELLEQSKALQKQKKKNKKKKKESSESESEEESEDESEDESESEEEDDSDDEDSDDDESSSDDEDEDESEESEESEEEKEKSKKKKKSKSKSKSKDDKDSEKEKEKEGKTKEKKSDKDLADKIKQQIKEGNDTDDKIYGRSNITHGNIILPSIDLDEKVDVRCQSFDQALEGRGYLDPEKPLLEFAELKEIPTEEKDGKTQISVSVKTTKQRYLCSNNKGELSGTFMLLITNKSFSSKGKKKKYPTFTYVQTYQGESRVVIVDYHRLNFKFDTV